MGSQVVEDTQFPLPLAQASPVPASPPPIRRKTGAALVNSDVAIIAGTKRVRGMSVSGPRRVMRASAPRRTRTLPASSIVRFKDDEAEEADDEEEESASESDSDSSQDSGSAHGGAGADSSTSDSSYGGSDSDSSDSSDSSTSSSSSSDSGDTPTITAETLKDLAELRALARQFGRKARSLTHAVRGASALLPQPVRRPLRMD